MDWTRLKRETEEVLWTSGADMLPKAHPKAFKQVLGGNARNATPIFAFKISRAVLRARLLDDHDRIGLGGGYGRMRGRSKNNGDSEEERCKVFL